jgi:hypothetical protein
MGKIFGIKRKKRFFFLYLPLILVIGAIVTLYLVIVNPGSEHKIDGFRDFRAEGLSLSEAAPSGIKYFRKYLHKSSKAPDSVVAHFREQSRLIEQRRGWESVHYGGGIAADSLLRVSFVGDIMWIRNGWNTFLDSKVRDYLSESDMVFGNLETPVDTLTSVPFIFPDYASYNAHSKLLTSFRRDDGSSVFTALSVANNHAMDLGERGLARTLEFLEKEGINYSGAGLKPWFEALDEDMPKRYLLIEKRGIKIGFYAAAWGLNNPSFLGSKNTYFNYIPGIAPLKKENMDLASKHRIVKQMKDDGADFIVLFLHWGYEYELYPDPEIIRLGRELAKAGADLIIGSHPHVIQPSELYSDSYGQPGRRSFIAYSLGNFTTTMYTPLCRLGAVMTFEVFRDPATGRVEWKIPETRFVYNNPSGIAGIKRKLVFYDDYIKKLSLTNPAKASKIGRELKVVLENY